LGKFLKVYLLAVAPDRREFYGELVEPPESEGEHEGQGQGGRHRWAVRRLRLLEASWKQSEGRGARVIRGLWSWLQRRAHPDEPLLARLRSAGAITVHHPASMDAEVAGVAWSRFLKGGRRRHLPWLIFDSLVAPLTIVLMPLPGPNLIGYWFLYRAIHQLLILTGLRRASRGAIETRFQPLEALDPPIAEVALDCDPQALHDFLERRGIGPKVHETAP
jgi:hypothetical protein